MNKYIGVAKYKDNIRFRSYTYIKQDGRNKQVYLGIFITPEEAACAHDDFIVKNNLNRKLNFPTKYQGQ